jgi:hypothetical protein
VLGKAPVVLSSARLDPPRKITSTVAGNAHMRPMNAMTNSCSVFFRRKNGTFDPDERCCSGPVRRWVQRSLVLKALQARLNDSARQREFWSGVPDRQVTNKLVSDTEVGF